MKAYSNNTTQSDESVGNCSVLRVELKRHSHCAQQERLHDGGNGARCTMAKIGGGICDDQDAFTRIYNNLLLHEYIYYFTPVYF